MDNGPGVIERGSSYYVIVVFGARSAAWVVVIG